MQSLQYERGFALIEIIVAAGVWVVSIGAFLFLAQTALAGARTTAEQRSAYTDLSRLAGTWDAEASGALAIFVPQRDVLGGDNADGHELDFYSRDARSAGRLWAYRWDRERRTIQRYAFPSPGNTPIATGSAVSGIASFQAARKAASTIGSPFLAGYLPKDVAVNFGYPGVDGGNAFVRVRVANARAAFETELLAGTLPSGFQVVVSSFTPEPASPPPSAPANAPGGGSAPDPDPTVVAAPTSPGASDPPLSGSSSSPAASATPNDGATADPTVPPGIPPRPADVVHLLKCWEEPSPRTTFQVHVIDTWTWDPVTWSWILVPGMPPDGDIFCE